MSTARTIPLFAYVSPDADLPVYVASSPTAAAALRDQVARELTELCDDVEDVEAEGRAYAARWVPATVLVEEAHGPQVLGALARLPASERGAAWEELLAEGVTDVGDSPGEFSFLAVSDGVVTLAARDVEDLPRAVRAHVEALHAGTDPDETGLAPDQVPAAIEADVAAWLRSEEICVISSADELGAFRAWLRIGNYNDALLDVHLATWRSTFPAPAGADPLAAYVAEETERREARRREIAENAARFEAARAEKRRADEEAQRAAPKDPVQTAMSAIIVHLAGRLASDSGALVRIADALAAGGTLTVVPPPAAEETLGSTLAAIRAAVAETEAAAAAIDALIEDIEPQPLDVEDDGDAAGLR